MKKILATLGLGLMLQGCESTTEVLQAANPVNWFEDDETVDQKTAAVPGQEEGYPTIGSVPEHPGEPAIKRDYTALKSGLVSDRENARYTDQVIRSQEIPTASMPTVKAAQLPVQVTSPANPPVANTVKKAPANAGPVASGASTLGSGSAQVRAAKLPAQNGAGGADVALAAPKAEPLAEPAAPIRAAQPPAAATQLAGGDGSAGEIRQPNQQVRPATSGGQQAALVPKLIANIYFADGATGLSTNDRSVVGQVIDIARSGSNQIRIVGHSSLLTGNAAASAQLGNYKISLDRANAVASEFVRQGMAAGNIQVDARGASEPVYEEMTPTAQAYNRRVEIFILQ